MRPLEPLLSLLLLTTFSVPLLAQDTGGEAPNIIKSPSPDGRFALRIQESDAGRKAALIEKASARVLVDIGTAGMPDNTILVWSADSKRVAYASRFQKEGDLHVYFWKGSGFEEVGLPDELPSADPKVPENSSVKNYGGAATPLKWLKSGDLEMSNDLMDLSRVSGKSYTGVVRFTIGFDAHGHASVKNVGKTVTHVE